MKVDAKARAIAQSTGQWDDRTITEMHIAVGFTMNDSDAKYLEEYVRWRRDNPL